MHRTLHVRADGRYERGARSSEHGARSTELGAGVHREGEALDSQASIEPKEVAPPPMSVSALKEWLPVISEVQRGATTLIFRRGGILDKQFELPRQPNARSLFFPTTFHVSLDAGAGTQYLKRPELYRDIADLDIRRDWERIECPIAFEVTGAWATSSPMIGEVLDAWHCYGPQFVEKRLGGARKGPLTVMEVRAFALDEPVVLENEPGLWGCFSWLELDGVVGSAGGLGLAGAACVDDEAFALRQEGVRDALKRVEAARLVG